MADWISSASNSVARVLEELTTHPPKSQRASTGPAARTGAADGLSENWRSNVENMIKAGMSAVCSAVETRVSGVANQVEEVRVSAAGLEVQ